MRGKRQSRRVALIVWAGLAFVTWNVVFDRQVYVAGVQFTRQQVERHQQGAAVTTLEAGFRPRVREAVGRASLWSGAVLAVGILLVTVADRRARRP